MTLAEREKKIVLIKYIIHGVSPFSEAPLTTRIKMLKSAVVKCGMKYDENELMELGQECIDLQAKLNNTLMQFLTANKDMLVKAHQEIDKGNDSLKGELGEDITNESAKILKNPNPKWYSRFR